MNLTPRTSPVRLMGSVLALAVLSVLALLSFTQCKYAPDKVTGLDRNKQSRSPASQCIRDCGEQFSDSLKAENKLHKANIKACGGGDDDDGDDDSNAGGGAAVTDGGGDDDGHHGDPVCIAAENERHRAALARIRQGLQDCIGSCHHQGGGSGGR